MNCLKNIKARNVVLTFIVLIGIVLLLKSLDFANNLTHSWVQSVGGDVDTSTYNIMLNNYMNVFQISGGILLGIGVFLLLYSVLFYKE
ncbi:hypothetical protein BK699_25465 [Bacillus thuringiensis serovar mexicanensis]|uniref:Group-specific protein n=2 Tax=Bacillus thuringiensis TaxID=1428 RepID=A0AB33B277_BACTU|nr:hypothetical protein BF38_2128 [Bacillus thuringiensis]EEM61325.1 hypothetical protein bthur0007_7850 [Bacillus thuringiensis serovar monterrey BGSC 4AJ1]EEM79143.1 hypothetical protein bthur0010_7700 [Bacillus thuringiensis serovar pondicheriensis BGSC 4BA1]OPD56983.1 hypothetical protein BVG01_20645 [Bacillus anthracis]OTW45588.1 hypothetical protein BK699_25465 [Bacillus thuringiensis serovar mexicanensis]OTW95406.1 hypothetical protein BK705_33495 [Bacillus thuringiensis serovar monterr